MPNISTLLTADETSAKLKGRLSAERLSELASAKMIPHFELDGRVLFAFKDAHDWLSANLLLAVPGRPIPENIVITPMILRDLPPEIPIEIRSLAPYLLPLPVQAMPFAKFGGVYFLCRGGKVVYVGQSLEVAVRVGAHAGSKLYDYAFCMRVPASDLTYVEGAMIRMLAPEYNRDCNGRLYCSSGNETVGPVGLEFVELLHDGGGLIPPTQY